MLHISQINFEGNITPQAWYKNLKYESGKPNLNAITILAEIAYWYRPVIVVDQYTKQITGYEQKFKDDILQYSYEAFENKFGLTQKQTRDALIFLEDKNVVKRELRNIKTKTGTCINNLMYISLDFNNLTALSILPVEVSEVNLSLQQSYHTLTTELPCPYNKVKTNTKTTTKTSSIPLSIVENPESQNSKIEETKKDQKSKTTIIQKIEETKNYITASPLYQMQIDQIKSTNPKLAGVPNVDELALCECALAMVSDGKQSVGNPINWLNTAYSKVLSGYISSQRAEKVEKELAITEGKEQYFKDKKNNPTFSKPQFQSQASRVYGKPPMTLNATECRNEREFESKKTSAEYEHTVTVIRLEEAQDLWREGEDRANRELNDQNNQARNNLQNQKTLEEKISDTAKIKASLVAQFNANRNI